MFEERALDRRSHLRGAFDCGVPALNQYLLRYAEQHRRKGISATYVLAESAKPAVILGYYTLSAAEVDVASLAEPDRHKLPRYPIPCFRMGRLATHLDWRGQGLGRLLVGCAVDRCLRARVEVAAYALLVDAKDAVAARFYEHYGFKRLQDRPASLYLPLGRRLMG